MSDSFYNHVVYHIYPLGLTGAPRHNDYQSAPSDAFYKMAQDLERIRSIGFDTILIGPVFESGSHGYDTTDLFQIDRRLGDRESFAFYVHRARELGFKVMLDAVFNHTGRDFFAFRDILEKRWDSPYVNWYSNLRFDRNNEYNDGFDYDGWSGCKDLVKLNLENPDLTDHLFEALRFWIEAFDIDGLRLDSANVLAESFIRNLRSYAYGLKPDFFLMGEIVSGDYNRIMGFGKLDSVTNYEVYKGLWSSIKSRNLFELNHSLRRQFSKGGIYENHILYNFLDNHDVNRIASTLTNPQDLFVAYSLLFAIPGIPSVYYGSELGILGKRDRCSDVELRPALPPFTAFPEHLRSSVDSQDLASHISHLSAIHRGSAALSRGSYNEVSVRNESLVFERAFEGERVWVFVNLAGQERSEPLDSGMRYMDLWSGEVIEGGNSVTVGASSVRFLRFI